MNKNKLQKKNMTLKKEQNISIQQYNEQKILKREHISHESSE